jgi:hypothetical protein
MAAIPDAAAQAAGPAAAPVPAAAPAPAAPPVNALSALRGTWGIAATSRRAVAPVWKYVTEVPGAEGFTHACKYPDEEGQFCGAHIKVFKHKKSWSTTEPLKHFAKMHKDSPIARSVATREEDSSGQKSLAMDAAARSPVAPSTMASYFTLSPEVMQQSSQALWYIYSPGCVSKSTFEEPHFRGMLKAFAQKGPCAVLTTEGLSKFVRAEFHTLQVFLKHIFAVKCVCHLYFY